MFKIIDTSLDRTQKEKEKNFKKHQDVSNYESTLKPLGIK